MRVIGMLGGMSWQSTTGYYRLANELVAERLGGLHSARILLDSVDFAEIEAMQTSDRWDDAGALLAERARALESAGAELLLVCANTMHKVIGPVEDAVSIPVLHIVDATADALLAQGVSRAGLLGTAYTMEQDFYRDRLHANGVEPLVPRPEDRQLVHRIIFEELVKGIITEESRAAYRAVIERLAAEGAEGIILGCTEIEYLIGADDSPVPIFPSTRIHVEAAVTAALA
ncbi:aspartate/glutamate racemase family protein [Tessaracoccus terricola]